MVVYSIKDLERLSGVKAHTLRIWEKRYGIIQPKRTETNIRYYLDQDLRHVLNIAVLNNNGYKISKIANMTSDEIQKKVAQITEVDAVYENQLDSLTLSILELNEYKVNSILDANITQTGLRRTMVEVIYPLLDKLSMMWITGSIKGIHESFISQIIERKTIAEIDKIKTSPASDELKFIIYLPESEDHNLSLLFLHYLIKDLGYKVLNLGTNVRYQDLFDAYAIHPSDYIFTIFNSTLSGNDLKAYIGAITENIPDTKLLLTGLQVVQGEGSYGDSVITFGSLSDVIDYLGSLRNKG